VLHATLKRAIRWDNPCKNCMGQVSEVRITKTGLIYIDTRQCHGFSENENIMQDKNVWNKIIWSNPLYLNK